MTKDEVFDLFSRSYDRHKETELTLKQYLEGCRTDPMFYASAAERMMKAVGEPTYVDTARDQRLGRIFMNRTLKVYPAFKDFYGLDETIERRISAVEHVVQFEPGVGGVVAALCVAVPGTVLQLGKPVVRSVEFGDFR